LANFLGSLTGALAYLLGGLSYPLADLLGRLTRASPYFPNGLACAFADALGGSTRALDSLARARAHIFYR